MLPAEFLTFRRRFVYKVQLKRLKPPVFIVAIRILTIVSHSHLGRHNSCHLTDPLVQKSWSSVSTWGCYEGQLKP